MIPLSKMNPIADDSLKDHERDLFGAFLSLLADETEPQDLVALLFWKDPAGRSSVLAATGLPTNEPSPAISALGDAALHWVHRHNRPMVLDNGVGILGRMQAALDKAGLRSAAIFPLSHRGHPVGALVLGRRTGPSPFVFVDLILVTLFGHLLSTAFERLRLFEWMQTNVASWQADPSREVDSMLTDQMSREVASPPRRTGRVLPPDSPSAAAHKSGRSPRPKLRALEEQHMYICLCKGITETELWEMVARHSGSWEGVKGELGLDESCCGRCEAQMEKLIKEVVRQGVS